MPCSSGARACYLLEGRRKSSYPTGAYRGKRKGDAGIFDGTEMFVEGVVELEEF